jgi:hypothetical protein
MAFDLPGPGCWTSSIVVQRSLRGEKTFIASLSSTSSGNMTIKSKYSLAMSEDHRIEDGNATTCHPSP